ncbi:NHLP leader peptide family RiPP precursor [Ruegeria sp. 2205SS24-7]|uniref:NHLP leader peptide family RiPP precursor n=1 Tax=Ruegeria discodermiae TaxID=3064389 RepID=UPI0027414B43|nr:NHLP leader peptide family RiPP precursor [Ruegeria sp. 2205SS24-7]MDP5218257.1 NHLP leader peptide family RiPP precursor [Ruegeria sp. 2205SS24-7]
MIKPPLKSDLLNRVWTDKAYRARLHDNPHAALAEVGVQVPNSIQIKLVMDCDRVRYLHIPTPPQQGEISDRDLLDAQGGTTPICAASVTIVTTHIAISVTAHV